MPIPLPKTPLATFHGVGLHELDRWTSVLVRLLSDRMSIGLVGTLGAGKTRLVQSLAAAAAIDPAEVTSPTFTLLRTHAGCKPQGSAITLHHLDAYRIADEDEFLHLGVEELFEQSSAWTLVEWADRVAEVMPPETLWVKLEIEPAGQSRRIELFSEEPARLSELVRELVRNYEKDS